MNHHVPLLTAQGMNLQCAQGPAVALTAVPLAIPGGRPRNIRNPNRLRKWGFNPVNYGKLIMENYGQLWS